VPDNDRRGRPQGKCHRKQTAPPINRPAGTTGSAGRFVGGARVKRWGKSPPRDRQRERHGKPHREQDRIGTARGETLRAVSGPPSGLVARGAWQHAPKRNGRHVSTPKGVEAIQNPAYRPAGTLFLNGLNRLGGYRREEIQIVASSIQGLHACSELPLGSLRFAARKRLRIPLPVLHGERVGRGAWSGAESLPDRELKGRRASPSPSALPLPASGKRVRQRCVLSFQGRAKAQSRLKKHHPARPRSRPTIPRPARNRRRVG
jgi:hypothetical protein